MTDKKQRRQRRTKASIVSSIDQAARYEIAEHGFMSSLVTNIIKTAQIEPQVFYNRYKDIGEFYDAFVRQYDSMLDDVIDKVDDPLISKSGVTSLLKEILRAVNNDSVALELIRWEVSECNKTTMRSSMLRELNFQPLINGFTHCFNGTGIDMVGIFSLLLGGLYFISLRKKTCPLYGIDLNKPQGIARMESAMEYLIRLVYDSLNSKRREIEIAQRLRENGVHEDVISQAFAPTNGRHKNSFNTSIGSNIHSSSQI